MDNDSSITKEGKDGTLSSFPCLPTPALQYMAIAREATYIYNFSSESKKEDNDTPVYNLGKAVTAVYSHDGNMIAFVLESAKELLQIKSAENFETLRSYRTDGPISKIEFSPLSKHILLFSRFDENSNKENVHIYEIENNKTIFKCAQKKLSKSVWPSFKWTGSEKYCCRLVTNGVHIYETCQMHTREIIGKIMLDKLSAFEPSPESPKGSAYIAIFTNEWKGTPATIQIYDFNNLKIPKATKSFFDADECQFKFNFDGSSFLALTQNDVDKSGKSYYGSNKLFFFKSDGSSDGKLLSSDDGPVHDMQWSPTSSEFLLAKGTMPPEIVLYDGNSGRGKTSYGNLRRNTIRWNPFGKIFLIGGFGNLAGDVHIIHKTKQKVIGDAKIPCAVQCEFSPDGLHFFAATTNPRLRVDNCIKIYRYNGEMLHKIDFNELYYVSWRMREEGIYKDVPPSLGIESVTMIDGPKYNNNIETAGSLKGEVYRPRTLATMLRQQRAHNEFPKISSLDHLQQKVSTVPGAAQEKLSKSAIRNARRKKGKADKNKEDEAKEDGNNDNGEIIEEKNEEFVIAIEKKNKDKTEENCYFKTKEASSSTKDESKTDCSLEDLLKKQIKTIKKKLTDIGKLKQKENLDKDQQIKVNSEEKLKSDVDKLQAQLSKLTLGRKK